MVTGFWLVLLQEVGFFAEAKNLEAPVLSTMAK